MNLSADDTEITAIHDLLATSPQVLRFATLSHDDAYHDFERIFSCNPDLVDSIQPKDLPVSFRLITGSTPDTAHLLQTTMSSQPGVARVDSGSVAAEQEQADSANCFANVNEPTPST
jgi:hypothetical protein